MKKTFLIAVFAFVLAAPVDRALAIQDLSLYLGMGTFSHGIFDVSDDPSASAGIFGTFYFPFVAQTSFNMGSGLHLAPQVGYTVLGTLLFPSEAPDGGSKKSYFTLTLPVVYMPDESGTGFDWEAGPMFLVYTIMGSGGQVSLNNGSGFENFGLPGNTRTSYTWGLLLGGGYNADDFRIDFDLVSEGILSQRRTFSLMLTVSYNLLPSSSYGGGDF